jgi:hypothetical protein
MQVYKSTGKMPKQLAEQTERPEELEYILAWYSELRTDAQLTFTEMKNWCDLTKIDLLGWEIDILKALDRIYWSSKNG